MAIINCLVSQQKSKQNCASACGQIDTDSILNNIIVSNTIICSHRKDCMQNRINSLYDEIAEATENLETVQTQIKAIKH